MTGGSPPEVEPWPFQESNRHSWPTEADAPGDNEFKKNLHAAWLEVRKKRTDQEIERAKAGIDADLATEQEYFKAVIETAKGTIERSRASAETVQTAAGAIVALYTGILGFVFSVEDRALPEKSLFAVILLALAIVLSTAYLAYLPDPEAVEEEEETVRAGITRSQTITDTFIVWARGIASERRRWLRSSVIALATSVIFLPAPFVTLGIPSTAPEESTPIPWPSPDAAAGTEVELRKIVYQAQVDEVVQAREAPIAQSEKFGWVWGVGFLVALLAVWKGPGWYPDSD